MQGNSVNYSTAHQADVHDARLTVSCQASVINRQDWGLSASWGYEDISLARGVELRAGQAVVCALLCLLHENLRCTLPDHRGGSQRFPHRIPPG